ncbi:MAG: nucleoside diphosphate kinase regulator [Arenimonas sp.]|jgi:regulator of nucleoside diphosphate kinase|nr:nucleoside diphosphate kinase regulator [Arenimonas sp.]
MSELPPITITQTDWNRLDALLSSERYENLPGLDGLRVELERANVVADDAIPADVVAMDSTVRFAEAAAGREFELKLVYPNTAGADGTVSILAPIGSALLGLSVGQEIDWALPGGRSTKVRVLSVRR